MTRPVALVAIIIVSVLVMLAAAREGRDNPAPTASSAAPAEQETGAVAQATLRIEGMTWFTWPLVVKRALEGLDGVKKAEVSFPRGTAEVIFDPSKVTVDDMIRAVEKAGFKGSPLKTP